MFLDTLRITANKALCSTASRATSKMGLIGTNTASAPKPTGGHIPYDAVISAETMHFQHPRSFESAERPAHHPTPPGPRGPRWAPQTAPLHSCTEDTHISVTRGATTLPRRTACQSSPHPVFALAFPFFFFDTLSSFSMSSTTSCSCRARGAPHDSHDSDDGLQEH